MCAVIAESNELPVGTHIPNHQCPLIARTDKLQHTLNVDVTSYADGRRSTLPAKDGTQEGAADAAYVWQHFDAGCSVRMLHPQRWCDALWKVRSFAF